MDQYSKGGLMNTGPPFEYQTVGVSYSDVSDIYMLAIQIPKQSPQYYIKCFSSLY